MNNLQPVWECYRLPVDPGPDMTLPEKDLKTLVGCIRERVN